MPFLRNFYELITILPQLTQKKDTTGLSINGSAYHLVCTKFSFQFCLKLGSFLFYNNGFKEESRISCPLQLIATEVYILTRIFYHMNKYVFLFLTLHMKLSADQMFAQPNTSFLHYNRRTIAVVMIDLFLMVGYSVSSYALYILRHQFCYLFVCTDLCR